MKFLFKQFTFHLHMYIFPLSSLLCDLNFFELYVFFIFFDFFMLTSSFHVNYICNSTFWIFIKFIFLCRCFGTPSHFFIHHLDMKRPWFILKKKELDPFGNLRRIISLWHFLRPLYKFIIFVSFCILIYDELFCKKSNLFL